MDLAEGMDHALVRDASKGPRKDHHVKSSVAIGQLLRGTDSEPHVPVAGPARDLSRLRDRFGVWIQAFDPQRQGREGEREPAVAAAEVKDFLAPHEPRTTPRAKLVERVWTEHRRKGRDVTPEDVADRLARAAAQAASIALSLAIDGDQE